MGFSIISFLIWILNPISVIRSLRWLANSKIPVLSEAAEYGSRRWSLIRKWGLSTLIVLSLYLLIIVVILGWTFRWYPAYLVLQTFCFIILDRYLIAVNYSKEFWQDASQKIKREIKITRVIKIMYLPVRMLFGLLMILMIPFANVTDFTIETWLYISKGQLTKSIRNSQQSADISYPFGINVSMSGGYKITTEEKGKIIIYNNSSFFERKLFIFMKSINREPKWLPIKNIENEQLKSTQ